MKRLTEYFLLHKTVLWSILLMLAVGGVYSYVAMPKLEDPATTDRVAVVAIPYPGADAEDVEKNLAIPVERELHSLPDIKDISVTCCSNVATFKVEFSSELDAVQAQYHYELLRRRVHDIESSLPGGTYSPIIMDDLSDIYGIMYAMTGDGYSYEEMYEYAKILRTELLSVKGVKRVKIVGKRSERINIDLSREKVASNGLLPTGIMLALQSVGNPVLSGSLTSGSQKLPLDAGESSTLDRIKSLNVPLTGGSVLLEDLVDGVSQDYAEPQTGGYFINGEPALAICVSMEDDAVVPKVGRAVDKCRKSFEETVPAGIEMQKVFFQPDMVDSSVSGFLVNLAESVLIVILVLALFMGLRESLVIGFGLILTILASFVFLNFWGTTLQRISLGAFIIAMGMLVDNAVVVMDGILVDRNKGVPHPDCLTGIIGKSALPLLGATLIAIFSFVGVYLSEGSVAEYASDLFKVVAVSLLVSWLLAITQIPSSMNREFCRQNKENRASAAVQKLMNKLLGKVLSHKVATACLAALLLTACALGFKAVKFNLFCDFEYNQFVVECFWPQETDANTVRDNLLEMSDLLLRNDKVRRVCTSQGSAPARYCMFRPMTSGGECYGELMVDFENYKTLKKERAGIRELLRENYPDASIRIRGYNFSISTSHPIEVEFTGDDIDVLHSLAESAKEIMHSLDVVDKYTVQDNWAPKGKYIDANCDEIALRSAGLSHSDVAGALQACTSGKPIGVTRICEDNQVIYLNVKNADGSAIEDLSDIPVWSMLNLRPGEVSPSEIMGGALGDVMDRSLRSVPLSAVSGGLQLDFREEVIRRHNGKRAIEVECDTNPYMDITSDAALKQVQKAMSALELPEGYTMEWYGDLSHASDSINQVLTYSIIGILVIIIILLVLFNSWKCIAAMALCLPFVICGISPVLLATGLEFTFMALIGILGLIGMMLKNTIVLLDEIRRTIGEMGCCREAVIQATLSRVRPVLMSSITTIVGVIPLLGDAMYGSMAATIMGGLLMGTLTTLVLFPLFYSLIFKISR